MPVLTRVRWPLLCLAGLCSYSILVGLSEADLTFSASRTICFFPFFAAGFWCKENGVPIADRDFRGFDLLVIFSLIVILIVLPNQY